MRQHKQISKLEQGELIISKFFCSITKLDVLPTFEWNSDGSLTIDFNDGGVPDIANLQRISSQFGNDQDDEANNECMMTGFLSDESTVAVRVRGCPGHTSFQV